MKVFSLIWNTGVTSAFILKTTQTNFSVTTFLSNIEGSQHKLWKISEGNKLAGHAMKNRLPYSHCQIVLEMLSPFLTILIGDNRRHLWELLAEGSLLWIFIGEVA